jgi:hypothetical protein
VEPCTFIALLCSQLRCCWTNEWSPHHECTSWWCRASSSPERANQKYFFSHSYQVVSIWLDMAQTLSTPSCFIYLSIYLYIYVYWNNPKHITEHVIPQFHTLSYFSRWRCQTTTVSVNYSLPHFRTNPKIMLLVLSPIVSHDKKNNLVDIYV